MNIKNATVGYAKTSVPNHLLSPIVNLVFSGQKKKEVK